jgi:threonine dehydrogenase-like Zn-dependent dehydrogenase
VQDVPKPKILNSRDAIVKISSTAICGSDLHLYGGFIPTMRKGDVLGHEFTGEVVETGSAVTTLKVGGRVVVPFPIACGNCGACERGLTSVGENSNPNARIAENWWATHRLDCSATRTCSAVTPAGRQSTRGCRSPTSVPSRSKTAFRTSRCCSSPTSFRPATSHIDVGALQAYDRAKQAVGTESDRPHALREAIMACANGGVVSVIGVYGGLVDKLPMGVIMNRSLRLRSGRCHVHRYMAPLMQRILAGEIDPSFVITHRMTLDEAPRGYTMFREKQDDWEKVVLRP